jgi:hypothetical protein
MEVASHGGEAKTAVQRGFECEQACIASLPLAPYPPPMDRGQGQGTMQYSSRYRLCWGQRIKSLSRQPLTRSISVVAFKEVILHILAAEHPARQPF